jgi:hypothetical protein
VPIVTSVSMPPALAVTGLVAAVPGLRVEASLPRDASASGIPVPSSVVAWVQLEDPDSAGGVRIEPVFLADGRAWTPDQFRAAYGAGIDLKVA